MTTYRKLYGGISMAAWGYFFTYFDFKLNMVSLLPSFVGYLLFLSAIRCLKEEERELSLLRTLGIVLAVWNGAKWGLSWFSINLDGAWQFADIIVSLVDLYFRFQFLTNLASIAAKYQHVGYELDSKLRLYRTWQTVLLTAITVVSAFYLRLSEVWTILSITILIADFITGICLMKALFDFRKCLEEGL